MKKTLEDLKKGDKVLLRLPFTLNEGRRKKVVYVTRVNRKSITVCGERWDKKTGYIVGDRGYSSSRRIEPWDETRHPFEDDVRFVRDAAMSITTLVGASPRYTPLTHEQIASVAADINLVLSKLEGMAHAHLPRV